MFELGIPEITIILAISFVLAGAVVLAFRFFSQFLKNKKDGE